MRPDFPEGLWACRRTRPRGDSPRRQLHEMARLAPGGAAVTGDPSQDESIDIGRLAHDRPLRRARETSGQMRDDGRSFDRREQRMETGTGRSPGAHGHRRSPVPYRDLIEHGAQADWRQLCRQFCAPKIMDDNTARTGTNEPGTPTAATNPSSGGESSVTDVKPLVPLPPPPPPPTSGPGGS